jgi:hypothetical protein
VLTYDNTSSYIKKLGLNLGTPTEDALIMQLCSNAYVKWEHPTQALSMWTLSYICKSKSKLTGTYRRHLKLD